MKKPITRLFAALALSAGITGTAQVKLQPCVTYNAMEEVFANDPAAKQNYEAAQAILNQMSPMPAGKSAAFEYTVPVVFHILHTGGNENISDATCQQAIDWVNKDFQSAHADNNTVQQPFQGMMVDADIKFMLAHKDPQGNGTTGIIHHYDSRTVWDRNQPGALSYNSFLYAGITWPATKYLNIIIVKEIVSAPGQIGVVVGYTFKPGTHGNNDTRDAVVMTASFMNNIMDVRNLTHEIGHWLNLSHTFGDTNNPGQQCGDDNVCDTPPTYGEFSTCPGGLSGNSCATTSTCGYSAGMSNVENIMNYSSCPKNFTQGQSDRMRAALASNVSGRSNLWQPANLSLTGVDLSGPFPPMADFTSLTESYTVCAGNSLTFKDYSFNGTVDTYNWSTGGAGGIVSNGSTSLATVLFPVTGTVSVNLTVGNQLGSNVKTKIVTVQEGLAQLSGPMNESFELGVLPTNWQVVNVNSGSTTWKPTAAAASDGSRSYMIEGALMGASQRDELHTPVIDMANSPVKEITFSYAYAHKSGSTAVFSVQASADCGGSWVTLFQKSANQLSYGSGGNQNTPFTPTPSQWITYAVSTAAPWSTIKDSPHVTLKFVFTEGTTGNGNNFYLDNITLPMPDALSELKNSVGLNMFPNPTDGKVNLQFTLSQSSDVHVSVTDLAGRKLMSVADSNFGAGQHTLEINSGSNLANGIYMVNINVNGVKMTEKLIVR